MNLGKIAEEKSRIGQLGWYRKLSHWLLLLVLSLASLLTACDLPQVSAEERLFLNLSLDFLAEYRLPKLNFENAPIGGISAITYDRQRNCFYALSDDRSDHAPARFYTFKLSLKSDPASPGIDQIEVTKVTALKDATGQTYAKGSLDPEGIALSPQGSVFISSEGVVQDGIAPFLQEFDLETGSLRQSLPIPKLYLPAAESETPQGVQDNLGFESLTSSPWGAGMAGGEPFRLFTATEFPLIQDQESPDAAPMLKNRLLHYLVEEGRSLLISEHLYPLSPAPATAIKHGLTELLAIDQGGHFLSLERSFTPAGFQAQLFQSTTGGATDINGIASLKGEVSGIQPVRKRLLLDLSQLGIPLENLEGMTLGPRLPDGSQSLLLVSDDNFQPSQATQFLLFRLRSGR